MHDQRNNRVLNGILRPLAGWSIVAGVLVSLPNAFGVSVSEAAKATGAVAVTIVRNTTGVSSTSNFEVGLPPVTDSQIEIDVEADSDSGERLDSQLSAAQGLSQPATFNVSGAPNQVYSVSIPTASTSTTTSLGGEITAVVVFSDFSHDAGITPTIGVDGSGTFAVGGTVTIDPAIDSAGVGETAPADNAASRDATDEDTLDAVDESAGEIELDTGDLSPGGENQILATQQSESTDVDLNLPGRADLLTASGTSNGDIAAAVRLHNPFSFAYDPRFLNVLVSYN